MQQREVAIARHEGYCAGRFQAMASPCEVLVEGDDLLLARRLTEIVAAEAWRIEGRFSRYRNDSVVAALNDSNGRPVAIDAEVERLLDYADTCFRLSGGAFDVTSGVLRRAWKFDGSDRLPEPAQVAALLPRVGWEKLQRQPGTLCVPPGMEIDFGGIGKEYAVDRALALAGAESGAAVLVNFGGDLACSGSAAGNGREWSVGIEAPDGGVAKVLKIRAGAMATSGDARRFLLRDGMRYGHILDPRTGWPVVGAPRAVTVVAATCIEAGTLATLAILRGAGAGDFLLAQEVQHWVLW